MHDPRRGLSGRPNRSALLLLALAVGLSFATPTVRADPQILDWDSDAISWPQTNPSSNFSETFPIGSGEVSIAFSGETGAFIDQTPAVASSLTGGLFPARDSLLLKVNFPKPSTFAVPITIDFSHPGGVSNVSFSMFDVDRNTNSSWDEVQVTAIAGGSPIDPTSVVLGDPNPAIGNRFIAPNVVSGTSPMVDTDPRANASFTFETSGITSVTIVFRYPGPSDPLAQTIALHDITFEDAPSNLPPDAQDDTAVTDTDVPVKIDVLDNDSDPDDDDLGIVLLSSTTDQAGTVVIDGDEVLYTPPAGFKGSDGFTYIADDGNGGTDTAAVVVTVNNAAPQAADDFAATDLDDPVAIDVLANDSDPNGDPLTIQLPGPTSAGASIAVNDNGTPGIPDDDFVDYIPPPGYQGSDLFQYVIDDGDGGTDAAEVSVTVAAIQADLSVTKTIDASNVTAGENVVFTVTLSNAGPDDALVQVTDLLPSGYLFVSASAPGSYAPGTGIWDAGTVAAGTNVALSVTAQVLPTGSYTNIAEVSFSTANDPNPSNDQADVAPSVNLPPIALDDQITIVVGAATTIDVLANDTDPDGDALTLELPETTTAQGGALSIVGNDLVEYVPPAGFAGIDTFQYTVSDGKGGTDGATVTVTSAPEFALRLDKSAAPRHIGAGDFVRYTVSAENVGGSDLDDLTLIDLLPVGFRYVEGSVRIADADDAPSVVGLRPVRFDGIDVPVGETVELTYVAQAGVGLAFGEYVNSVSGERATQPIGNTATADVTVAADPDFEETTILGKVYHDRNGDGRQDAGEEGVPGVRLVTIGGLTVETDVHGRYHLAGIDPGFLERGRNFILKVDPATLPRGSSFTTENPRVQRITRGMPSRFDFGVRITEPTRDCCTLIETRLGEIHFSATFDAVWPDFVPYLDELSRRLAAHGGGTLILEGVSKTNSGRVLRALRRQLGEQLNGYDVELRVPAGVDPDTRGGSVTLSGRFRIGLPGGGVVWATEDAMTAERRLAVHGPERLPVKNGGILPPATFHIATNYTDFIDRAEILLYRDEDRDRIAPLGRVDVPVQPYAVVEWDGRLAEAVDSGTLLSYVVRVYDDQGRFDETVLGSIPLVAEEGFRPPAEHPVRPQPGGTGSRLEAPETTPLFGNSFVLKPPTLEDRFEPISLSRTVAAEPAELDRVIADWRALERPGADPGSSTTAVSGVRLAIEGRPEPAGFVATYLTERLGLTQDEVVVFARDGAVELRLDAVKSSLVPIAPLTMKLVSGVSDAEVPLENGLAATELALAQLEYLTEPADDDRRADVQRSADAIRAVLGKNHLAFARIPIRGSKVRIHGQDVRDDGVLTIDGLPIPLDRAGRFAAEYLVPVGLREFDVAFHGHGARAERRALQIDVTGKQLFFVALAEATVSGSDLSGNVAPLSADDRDNDDLLIEGRVGLYLKGKIKGKYLLTARLDTTEDEVGDLLGNLGDREATDLFRRLDPDRYYAVYGDDSTTIQDGDSQGRMYVRVDWDHSTAVLGNFETGIAGNEFAQYNRSLWGARLDYRSNATTDRGDTRSHLNAFASEPQTALGHSEFLGTGGSLYYLRHRDVVPGSDKLRVEIRDRDTSRVVETIDLTGGVDYEIDEIQGRVLLSKPLGSIAHQFAPSLTKDVPLDGNHVVLLADYEYLPQGFVADHITAGFRGKHWIGENIAVGATYVEENRSGQSYRLAGGDLTLKKGRGSYLKLEYADTTASQVDRFVSDNGGLDFEQSPSVAPDLSGSAYGVEARANIKELFGGEREWLASAWWKTAEQGFSVARRDGRIETEYGAELVGHVGERVRLTARSAFEDRHDRRESNRIAVQGDFLATDRDTVSAEIRQVRDRSTADAPLVSGTLGAAQYRRAFTPAVDLYVRGQFTITDDDGRYASNDLGTVGTSVRIGDSTRLHAEVSSGDRGDGTKIQLDHKLGRNHEIYGAYTLSTDRTEPSGSSNFSIGNRSRLSDQTTVFTENRFENRDTHAGLSHLFGLDFSPGDGWTLGLTAQSGELVGNSGVIDREAHGISVARRSDATGWSTRVEFRKDKPNGVEHDEQWVASTRFDHRFSDSFRIDSRFNYSTTENRLDTLRDARLVEASLGAAYRPARNDRLRLLSKYTYLYDLPGPGQESRDTDQRSHIVAAEAITRVSNDWEIGAKIARRVGEVRFEPGRGAWFDSTVTLAAARAQYHVVAGWDLMLEARSLSGDESGGTRRGFLAALDRHFGERFKLGVGYNFTDFSDDLTDLDYEHRGWFVNFVTKR